MIQQAKHRASLGKHLILVVVIKIVVLYALWLVMIKPNKVKVDIESINKIYSVHSVQQSGGINK